MLKKWLYIVSGFIMFIVGTIGIFLPILPTTPFYLLTAYFWINSSPKLYNYFTNTRYYQHYIKEMIIEKKATKKKLFNMILMLFIVLLIPFLLINSLHMRIFLVFIFISHLIFGYFYFRRKKIKQTSK